MTTGAETHVHYPECAQDPCTCVETTEVLDAKAARDAHYARDCSHACNGNCCRSFTVGLSPVELGRKRLKGTSTDIVAITDMLIYQGHHRSVPVPGIGKKMPNDEPGHFYGCKHFDEATSRCTNYEGRPLMCRSYPYRKRCDYAGCGYKKPEVKPSD